MAIVTLKPPRARKGRREGENGPCASSPITRVSHAFHARLCAKNEASEEETDFRGCERNDIGWYSGAGT